MSLRLSYLKQYTLELGKSRNFCTQFVKLCSTHTTSEKTGLVDESMNHLKTLKKRKDILNCKRKILKAVRSDPLVEKAARNRSLRIPLDMVKEEWSKTRGFREVAFLAKYYGIFRDLFDEKEFEPIAWLEIKYGEKLVHRGNRILPSECLRKPEVSFNVSEQKLHSLLLVNPEGCYPCANAEVLHWMVVNIPGNNVEKGNELDYLPPLPWKGSGFHRFCFVLFEQQREIDNKVIENAKANRLEFRTRDFASEFDKIIAPVGLGWFQCEWDESVSSTSKESGIFEPIFEWEEFVDPKERALEIKRKIRSNRYRIKLTDDDILL